MRSHHVFYSLMALSAGVAFGVPPKFAGRFQPRVEVLFSPVSRPARAIALRLTPRAAAPAAANEHRSDPEIRDENEQLRAEVMRLNAQVAEQTRRLNELGKMGALQDLCQVTRVIGADSGNRDSVSISGTSLDGIKEDMWVVMADALVGQVQRAGIGGSQVRLVTDPAFRVRVHFCRFDKQFVYRLQVTPVLVQGSGRGMMAVRTLSLADVGLDADLKPVDAKNGAIVREGDYIVVDDNDCPAALQAVKVGKVVHVGRRADARMFAEIQIQPTTSLKRSSEVMVMTKDR